MTAPERIWITYESSLWPTFRTFHASSLDHSEAEGGYPEYVRADLVQALVDAASAQLQYMDMCGDKGDLERNLRAALAMIDKEAGE